MTADASDGTLNEQPEDDDAAPLSMRDRLVSGIIGGAALVIGAIAIFVSASDVGSGVLLAIGALFLLMATTGRPITSAKFGDNEIQLARRLQRQIEKTLDTAGPEVRPQLAEAVLEAAPAEWRSLTIKARWVVFEEQVLSELRELIPNADLLTRGDASMDAVIRLGEQSIAVDIKLASQRLARETVRRSVAQATALGFDKLIVIASNGFTRGAVEDAAAGALRIAPQLVKWSGPGDNLALITALRTLGMQVS